MRTEDNQRQQQIQNNMADSISEPMNGNLYAVWEMTFGIKGLSTPSLPTYPGEVMQLLTLWLRSCVPIQRNTVDITA